MEKILGLPVEVLRNWSRSTQENFYCQFYSSYLQATEEGNEKRAEFYRATLLKVKELWNFSEADRLFLEARTSMILAEVRQLMEEVSDPPVPPLLN